MCGTGILPNMKFYVQKKPLKLRNGLQLLTCYASMHEYMTMKIRVNQTSPANFRLREGHILYLMIFNNWFVECSVDFCSMIHSNFEPRLNIY